MSQAPRSAQAIVVGAGIAGLWTLRRLLAAGYDALLLEQEAIGSGQTLGAQGILHGGVKYGLDGSRRSIADLLRAQPPRWLDCLAGHGELNLSAARITSPCQYLWAADSWLAKVGATVGARALQGEVRRLSREEWPAALRDGGHRGQVHRLEETVVDVATVCTALAAPVADRILKGRIDACDAADGTLRSVRCGDLTLTADAWLFTAATGNEAVASALGLPDAAQRRPLTMIMARGALPDLWGHCVAVSPKPVVTITTHHSARGTVWYLGGGVAEDGVDLTHSEAIAAAARTLSRLLPGLTWAGVEWAAWRVDRAEPSAANRLPDGPALLPFRNAAVCWPTKLVYAPALADKALDFVRPLAAPAGRLSAPPPLPPAPMGSFPWDHASWTSL